MARSARSAHTKLAPTRMKDGSTAAALTTAPTSYGTLYGKMVLVSCQLALKRFKKEKRFFSHSSYNSRSSLSLILFRQTIHRHPVRSFKGKQNSAQDGLIRNTPLI
jgi:hypothetical protein